MPIILQDSQPKIYLGDYEMSVGGDVPVITTTTAAADLTGYEAGDTSLGNGFTITNDSGTIAVDSATVGGVTYNGLKIGGATTIQTLTNLSAAYPNLEFDLIITEYVSGDMRLISTGYTSDYALSVWVSSSTDYLNYVLSGAQILLDDSLVNAGGNDYYDPSITKASLLNNRLTVKYTYTNGFVILYVNGVAKAEWTLSSFNQYVSTDGLNIGANGAAGATVLVTKAEYSGETLTWDGRTWVPA